MRTEPRGGPPAELQELARSYGIETGYNDMKGRPVDTPTESLLRVLGILGAPVGKLADLPAALRERRQALWRRGLEPVTLAWDGGPAELELRLPERDAAGSLGGALLLESGETRDVSWDLGQARTSERAVVEGVPYVVKRLPLPGPLPWGYHRLTLESPGRTLATLVLSAPVRAYSPEAEGTGKTWGVFFPLYALHTRGGRGTGTYPEMGRLIDAVQGHGGGVVATLPLLAAFLDEPYEVSPYSPASRLFWNEFYLDPEAVPELAGSPEARGLLASAPFQRELQFLRDAPLVDYRREMALKRRVLEAMAQSFFASHTARHEDFERFVAGHPQAEDYARFRAVGERFRRPWSQWPAPQRDGSLSPTDYDEEVRRYHLFVQWLADEQLAALATQARRNGPGLYLDLPLGVNGNSYDVWRERDSFAVEASGGCPPDPVFTKGQDWGFPPLHPEHIREQGYRYVRTYVRYQLKYAGVLRIDHMPVFHRLFWVPHGMEARDGAYVRYQSEELYALFSLESHRHRTLLVGEDLGTMPPEVPGAMARHNVRRMFVIQYALGDDPKAALPEVPEGAAGSVNTHDMPPFAAYHDGEDIRLRQELGLLGDQDPHREIEHRRAMIDALADFLGVPRDRDGHADPQALFRASLAHLARSPAAVVLLNLEDLWEEKEPQNVPTTGPERPNWRKRARYTLEEFLALPEVVTLFEEIDRTIRGR